MFVLVDSAAVAAIAAVAAVAAVAAAAAVVAVALDLKQLVGQAEGRAVVQLVAVVLPLVNGIVGSSPQHPR